VIDAFAGILTWIRFAFIIFKVAQLAGESCKGCRTSDGGSEVVTRNVM